ncbi:LacI family DNA-binding transcriptional regulator [Enterococcus diestrammenae]|uniref:LacI family transcriptional regulator n=1 Tax=Enterococcus diestrammenae TaxID=1155073 RepID=A0ABV0F6N8_9ENTE|nr:LacI family DNA-binding transcriptional regulator [Enterococcus diestrammenae]KAF1295395.1 LacI family transcriptional regulator [Enterococcus diestrammenae]HIX70814.1 LacI family DNA-binding transcriptional regulator [Candidatus Enterococcus stercoravium]
MKATMKEVAKLAGVGVGTVSRVLNNGAVKPATRAKVEEAMRQLNYQPDFYARGLKMKHTQTIALILPTVWHPFFGEFAYHVETALAQRHYKLYLCNSSGDSAKEQEYIQMVTQNKVDGIIGITYSDIDEYISSNLPFVSIDRYFTEDVIYVTADNAAGGRLAANELAKRGCRKVAYIGGYQETPNETKSRRKYFEIECRKLGIAYESLDMLEPLEHVPEKVAAFLEKEPEIEGIFTINDPMALSVVAVLEQMGKSVPEDVQVIGFDGQKMTEGDGYLVSTIVQPTKMMAEAAVSKLLAVINGETVEKRTVLPVSFGAGGTTKELT